VYLTCQAAQTTQPPSPLSSRSYWRSSGVFLRNLKIASTRLLDACGTRRQLPTFALSSGTLLIKADLSIFLVGLLARIFASFELKPSAVQETWSQRYRSHNVFQELRHAPQTRTLRLYGIRMRPKARVGTSTPSCTHFEARVATRTGWRYCD
jgi:hypothetical protein